jgi:hypothetical protein
MIVPTLLFEVPLVVGGFILGGIGGFLKGICCKTERDFLPLQA